MDMSARTPQLGWMAEQYFSAYGLRFGLRTNDPAALAQARPVVPLGWQETSAGEVDILYSVYVAPPGEHQGRQSDCLLYAGSALIAHALELETVLSVFNKHAELLTAFRARDYLFVHAGVVGWQGRALVIPGRSMTGKTTLVKALIEAGAAYYSDEFAVLDRQGLAHSYPLPLSIRSAHGQPARQTPVATLGGQVGFEPLPVGMVVVTQYQPKAQWRPRMLSPGHALLALMDNTVAAQRDPTHSMPILRAVVLGARVVRSKRGEASHIASALLQQLIS
jgi:hypothetical protein